MSGIWPTLSKLSQRKERDCFLSWAVGPSVANGCTALLLPRHPHQLGPHGLSPLCVFTAIYLEKKAQLSSIFMKKSDFSLPWELTRGVMISPLPLDKF